MADEGVKIVDSMFVKLGKEAAGRGKRDLKRSREDYVNRTVKASLGTKDDDVDTIGEMNIGNGRLDRGRWIYRMSGLYVFKGAPCLRQAGSINQLWEGRRRLHVTLHHALHSNPQL